MLKPYHTEITTRALKAYFSPRALHTILAANLHQDRLRGQFGHNEYHFDANAFEASYAYMDEQREIVGDTLHQGDDPTPAWQALGRLTHTAQDFYAHSNYLRLWADSHPAGELPEPAQVGTLLPEFLHHPQLQSGNVYLWDWVSFIPGFYSLAYRRAPKDSHTHMNLDHPGRGPLFPYAIEAAIKRTIYEYEQIVGRLTPEEQSIFNDRRRLTADGG